jgi:hypothetical protein
VKCPHCGDERQSELIGKDKFFCNNCAKEFTDYGKQESRPSVSKTKHEPGSQK